MNLPAVIWNETRRTLLEAMRRVIAQMDDGGGAARVENTGAVAQIISQLSELTDKNRYYLARCFKTEDKHACVQFHHNWMLETFSFAGYYTLLTRNVELLTLELNGVKYSVVFGIERFVAREGELTIDLFADGIRLYLASFTVIPGRQFELDAREVFLISRVQGHVNRFEEVRLATKAMSDVAPKAMLFAVLKGIAKATGVNFILGVGRDNYINVVPQNRETLERQYDAFFQSLDATELKNGVYAVDLSAEPKPLTDTKPGHRIRTRRKREFKQQIAESVAQSWQRMFPPPQATDGPAAPRKVAVSARAERASLRVKSSFWHGGRSGRD